MAISKDVSNNDVDVPLIEELPQADDPTPPFDPREIEPLFLLNTLTDFSAPQTVKNQISI
jgi:hypothetical protein